MDRIKDNISLDHLARLLVDVQQDSSSIVDSIISQYQRDLLDLIFLGDAPNRNKVRSPRFEVLRRLHAIDATRGHQTRSGLVSFSSLGPFGRRGAVDGVVSVDPRRRGQHGHAGVEGWTSLHHHA